MSQDLVGRTVAISGGGAGIGRATVRALVAAGANVAVGDLDEGSAKDAAAEVGAPSFGAGLDVSDRESFIAFLDTAERRLGPIDVLINNAGIDWMGPFHEEPETVTRREIEVNLVGTLTGSKLAVQRMLPRRSGRVVNVSSGVGRLPLPGSATYSATKHAIVGLTESLRLEYRDSGVEFSLIQPAQVQTAMMDGQPTSRFMAVVTAEDVADAIVGAIVHQRFEVWVPAAQAMTMKLAGVLPRSTREAVLRGVGLTRIAGAVDVSSRDDYHRKAFGTS